MLSQQSVLFCSKHALHTLSKLGRTTNHRHTLSFKDFTLFIQRTNPFIHSTGSTHVIVWFCVLLEKIRGKQQPTISSPRAFLGLRLKVNCSKSKPRPWQKQLQHTEGEQGGQSQYRKHLKHILQFYLPGKDLGERWLAQEGFLKTHRSWVLGQCCLGVQQLGPYDGE